EIRSEEPGSDPDPDPDPDPEEAEKLGLRALNLEALEAEPAEATDEVTDPMDSCDFAVEGAEGSYSFNPETGLLTVTGDVTISMKEGKTSTGQSILVAGDAAVTLSDVTITAAKGPAILIESPHNVNLILAGSNAVTGAPGENINHVPGSFAGIEVEFDFETGAMASLTISGEGSLNATSGQNAAGIGGSNSANGSKGKGLYGNITINSGSVTATALGNGAGIGSSDNPGDGTSSGSYKKSGDKPWGTITINGGTVNATSTASGAGIGGGNHVDSSKIVITGGSVTASGAAGIGCGIGSSKNNGTGGDKGPGYYFADVTITGGTITASSNDIGAAIGGGMYCDADVTITGGVINATGGSRQGNTHHGGAGIGGGYLGHANVTITGGTINAAGGDGAAGIGSGGSPNSNPDRGINGRLAGPTHLSQTTVTIGGGDITARGGPQGGAGIGLGTGGDKVSVSITGGTVRAWGAASDRDSKRGGAGIGSGFQGSGSGSDKYFVSADADVSITGGEVLAVGGWGAAGIGSGAQNKLADTIHIEDAAKIEAYADGTKFAIDTRNPAYNEKPGTVHTDGRSYTGDLLQGTFVFPGNINNMDQDTEGLSPLVVTNDATGERKTLTQMPAGYRSFATDVSAAGDYTIFTDDSQISDGKGRYFNVCDTETYDESRVSERNVKYRAVDNDLSDNYFLFPVKAIVVEKQVVLEDAQDLTGLNGTVYFALWSGGSDGGYITQNADGSGDMWVESIEIRNGVPQGKAYFASVTDGEYDVTEIASATDGSYAAPGMTFGSYELRRVETRHDGAEGDNDGRIDPNQWTDEITVVNRYGPPKPPPTPEVSPPPEV
ncbi:MAG: hypothetical protein Q4E38_01455, partial [Eubacteriales bacterium]|nr:hypothetical protein [Eubacteriales bacterium]